MTPPVAIVHDYLTQRGGAERVVLSMLKAFPDAPVYTSFYEPKATFPEFSDVDVRTHALNWIQPLRRRHRLALPALAWMFSTIKVSADSVICSTSGWAHGASVRGRKIVYCYTPPRWLHQSSDYLRGASHVSRATIEVLRPYLSRWDRQAAASADAYITSSLAVRDRIRKTYGICSQVVPPPHAMDPGRPLRSVDDVPQDFYLTVSRLLPYKNLDVLVSTFRLLPGRQLVVVGDGPLSQQLKQTAPPNVHFLRQVPDEQLRWLYSQCRGLISASYEDFGLTPLEAASFGKPAAVLRWGGFLDTMIEGVTGVYFDSPTEEAIAAAIRRLEVSTFFPERLRHHAGLYSERRFIETMQTIVGHSSRGRSPGRFASMERSEVRS